MNSNHSPSPLFRNGLPSLLLKILDNSNDSNEEFSVSDVPDFLPPFVKDMVRAGRVPPLLRLMMKAKKAGFNQTKPTVTNPSNMMNCSDSNNSNIINNNLNNGNLCSNAVVEQQNIIIQNNITNNIISERSTVSQDNEHLADMSCLECRRLHKKCDRKLAFCSRCVTHGTNCVYIESRRKGRGKKNSQETSSPETKNSSEDDHLSILDSDNDKQRKIAQVNSSLFDSSEISKDKQLHFSTIKLLSNVLRESDPYPTTNARNKHLDKRQVLDFYQTVGNGLYIFERKKFEEFLKSKEAEDESGKREIHAMFLALKALCEQRSGLPELAEQTIKKARDLISKIFDEHSNMHVACCYAYMCLYEIAEGRTKTAQYYLHQVDFYVKQREEENQPADEDFKNLLSLRGFCSIGCNEGRNFSDQIKSLPSHFEQILGTKVPYEWKEIFSQDLSEKNYSAFISIFEIFHHLLAQHLKKNIPNAKLFKSTSVLAATAFKLRVLLYVNKEFTLIQELALKITLLSENELFIFVQPQVIPNIAAAAMINLNIVRQIEAGVILNNQPVRLLPDNPQEQSEHIVVDYYSILSKDYRILTVLAKRFKKVSLLHSNMLTEMANILARNPQQQDQFQDNNQSMNDFFANFEIPSFMPPNTSSGPFPFPLLAMADSSETTPVVDFSTLLSQNNLSMDLPMHENASSDCHLALNIEEIQEIYFNNYH